MNFVQTWQKEPRIKAIIWKDLLQLKKADVVAEMMLSTPWLIAEILFLQNGWYFPAAICAFFFFLTGLRQVHGGYHNSLGIGKRQTDYFLFIMSAFMLGSMHAVKYNHLQHHKHCLDENDLEAASAKMSGLGAIAFGPVFPVLLHLKALKDGNDYYKRWIFLELFLNAAIIICAAFIPVLFYHVVLMLIGQCLTAFFAVWTVHRGCSDHKVFARTQRGFLKNFVSYNMFYHVEHHLFPAIPQKNLPILAERLDNAVPELTTKNVF